jgi:hypothetical protein
MRELSVNIRFTTHCLGNNKEYYRDPGTKKRRHRFVFVRSPSGRVVFLPTWWRAIMIKAAEMLARCQADVKRVRYAPEIDGQPQRTPYTRYYEESKFTVHEVFNPGDVVGFSCAVPPEISDEDFERLLNLAGKYFGISPARPNEFGFFEVESVRRCGVGEHEPRPKRSRGPESESGQVEAKKDRRSGVAN